MSTLGELTTRIQMMLQDTQAVAWQPAQIRRELHHTLLKCARQFGAQDLVWVQAVRGKTHYKLNEQSLLLTAGTETSGASNTTTVTDSAANFRDVSGVVAGDRLRNLTDGSSGMITFVDIPTLVCGAGFTGGVINAMTQGDAYLVERPLEHRLVLTVHTVLYNGVELWPMSQEQMDRLTPGWEFQASGPKYWSTDQAETPSVVQMHPAPLLTGSDAPSFPMNPLPLRWEDNFVMILSESPEATMDAEEAFPWLDWYADLAVFETVARLTGFPGEWQNLSVSAGAMAIADLYRTRGMAS